MSDSTISVSPSYKSYGIKRLDTTLYVLKGTYYPYAVRYFKSTGTAPTITVTAVR